MASGPEKKKETSEEDASSVKEAGASASEESSSPKPADRLPAAGAEASPDVGTSEPPADDVASDELVKKPEDAEQLGLPGLPADDDVTDTHPDPHHDEYHHDEYDQYHDEYHEEHHYHDHGEYDEHHGDHHDDYHYHDNHYDDPQHSAYRRGARAALATTAGSGPLDQRSVPDYEPELDEDGNPYGGPVKPFLDHLEDLRWVIIKCVFTMLIAMMGCMMGARYLVKALTWPLKEAQKIGYAVRTDVPLTMGTKRIGRLDVSEFGLLGMDTNSPIFDPSDGGFELKPIVVGTNVLLALQPKQVARADDPSYDLDDIMVELKNYGPFESIWMCLQLALYGGLVIGAPFIIFFVAEFILPALKVSEKKFIYRAAGIGSILFFLGVAFCYFLIVQVALKASVEFSLWLGFGADEWKASEYISFVIKFLLVMGAAFEMPVVLLTIVKIGILNYKQLSEFRHYFIVGMLVVSAVITPSGDPFTMILVAVPLWILYEICVIIARVWYNRDQAEEARLAAAESSSGDGDGPTSS